MRQGCAALICGVLAACADAEPPAQASAPLLTWSAEGDRYRAELVREPIEEPHLVAPRAQPLDVPASSPSVTPTRPTPDITPSVRFVRRYPRPLTDHVFAVDDTDSLGYGGGGGLADTDGDGDLDVFLGQPSAAAPQAPFIYRNTSLPGDLRFSTGACFPELVPVYAAAPTDLDGDGRHELVVLGRDVVRLLRFGSGDVREEDLLAAYDERPQCHASSLIQTDLDLDGRADLIVGCSFGIDAVGRQGIRENLALVQGPDGTFTPYDGPDVGLLTGLDNTLSFLGWDVEDDGLGDIVIVNDTFSSEGQVFVLNPPGGVLRRCSPFDGCAFRLEPFTDDLAAWGSFMGAGVVRVASRGSHLFMADLGRNRLWARTGDAFVDRAETFGVQLADPSTALFTWGVVVEDFDLDGRDDLFVTQGMIPRAGYDHLFDAHQDVLFLQRSGRFEPAAGTGIQGPNRTDSRATRSYSSRGATRVDLDGNGEIELLIASLEGVPRLYTQLPLHDLHTPAHCTLDPRPRYVPELGHGYALAGTPTGPFRTRDVGGQNHFGLSPWITTDARQGWVRFPSGYVAAYSCRDLQTVVVEEPEWIRFARRDPFTLQVAVDGAWSDVLTAAVRIDGETFAVDAVGGDGAWTLSPVPADAEVMLQLGTRWIPRWFGAP